MTKDKIVIYVEKEYKNVLEKAVENNLPVLMIGDTGCGKTSFIRDLAQRKGIELFRLNLTGQTGVDEFLGKWLASPEKGTYWLDGLLIRAMKEGKWIVLDEINMCVDKTTECLTSNGWKKYNELSKDDLIATLNPKTNNVEYNKPNDIKIFNYEGDMVKLSGNYHEQLITPNHRVMLKEKHITYDKDDSRDIKTKRSNYKTIVDKEWKFIQAMDLKESYSGILIPTSGYISNKRKDVIGSMKAELLGLIITDGHLKKGCDAIEIYQSYSANKEKFEHISNLLDNLGIDYNVSIRDKKTILEGKEYNTKLGVFYLKSNSVKWVKQWISKKKEPVYDIFNRFSRNELESLFNGLILGDGDTDKYGKSNLTCGNEKVVNWFQTLLIHIGKGCTIKKNEKGYYKISINNRTTANLVDTNKTGTKSDYKSKENYKGIVWCLNIKNSNFLIRKQNKEGYWKTSFTGNCLPEILSALHSLLDDDRKVVLKEFDGSVVKPHEDFRLFATMNPEDEYAGTKELNKAFLSRFPVVMDIPYSPNEEQIVQEQGSVEEATAKSLVLVGREIRSAKKKNLITYTCSTRDLIYCATLMALEIPKSISFQMSILNKVPSEERESVQKIIELVTGDKIKTKTKTFKGFEEMIKSYDELQEKIDNHKEETDKLNKIIKDQDTVYEKSNKEVDKLKNAIIDLSTELGIEREAHLKTKDKAKKLIKTFESLSEDLSEEEKEKVNKKIKVVEEKVEDKKEEIPF